MIRLHQCIVLCIFLLLMSVGASRVFATPEVLLVKKVLILEFNPILSGGVRLSVSKGWNSPTSLESQYITEVNTASYGGVTYRIQERIVIDDIPVKADGFDYSVQSYLDCIHTSSLCHQPDLVDYQKILRDFSVCERKNRGEIDEVWLWGGPYFGYYEAIMAGPQAFYTNGPPLLGTTCQSDLHIMGFSYERGVAEMLHDLSHRTEGTMTHLFGGWAFKYGPPPTQEPQGVTEWDMFTRKDYDPGPNAACGFVHGYVNTASYDPSQFYGADYTNQRYVSSTCDDWLRYPNLTGITQQINCQAWSCTQLGFFRWWLLHLPHSDGYHNGKWDNWWRYVVDYATSIIVTPSPTPVPPTATPTRMPTKTPTPTPTHIPSLTPTPTSLSGDINGDCTVNVLDYGILFEQFGRNPLTDPRADLNHDGVVNILDYSILFENFGRSCAP